MKSAGDIESLAKRIAFEPEATAEERILSVAEAALDKQTTTPRLTETRLVWRQIMKTPLARVGMAAAVIIAVLLGMHVLRDTSNTAWANVLAQVTEFGTYGYRVREIETTGPRPDGFEFAEESYSTRCYSKIYGGFSETYKNDELFTRIYTLPAEGERVLVCYPLEVCERNPLSEAQISEFREKHPQRIIANILQADYTELGEDTIDGKRVKGVELRDPQAFGADGTAPAFNEFVAQIWIDAETELPVWVEVDIVPADSDSRRMIVMDQFQWGQPLAASLFEPNIPAGFGPEPTQVGERAYKDSAPRTSAAEAFAANTQAEPYLSDFDYLTLPDVTGVTLLGVDTSVAQEDLRLAGHEEIWQTQDAFMAQWPRYDEVEGQLAQELQTLFNTEQMTVEELISLGIALRERFWELRGCTSEVSYPYGYAARLVTKWAYERDPADPAVTDQYVESIMTTEVTRTYDEDDEARVRNPVYPDLLAPLRAFQFEQLKAKVTNGYVPAWKDFVRTHDLIILLSSNCNDCEGALEVTRWMIDQAPTAGWMYYLDIQLREMEEAYAAGTAYRTGLFMYPYGVFPEEFRYGRRLFSFQGPRARAEGLLPTHLRHLKGW